MKYVVDEIHPWNIPYLADDIHRLAAPLGDHTVWIWHGEKKSSTLRNPTKEQIDKALAMGVETVIVKRTQPEPDEPTPSKQDVDLLVETLTQEIAEQGISSE